ncbi:YoaK family protein [Bradyrhizobium sp. Pha-3]|uniref:YoaK family protein n=1 Tax=Bradyrhizobium sp. Pha-3 TaxID=208375 RepID=UPI0035D4E430
MAAASRIALPLLLSFNAGYVDTAGFLALEGLFTAHVTGNFVTLGAALAFGSSGALAKLLALPVFCAVVVMSRLLGTLLANRLAPVFEIFVGIKILLLIASAYLAIRFGPFRDGDSWQAILTGMVLVAAMAIQNAIHRVHLGSAPPSTLMTGTTTQIMLDLADSIYKRKGQERQPAARLTTMSASVIVFAIGCGAAALAFVRFGTLCFALPPVVAALSLLVRLAMNQLQIERTLDLQS